MPGPGFPQPAICLKESSETTAPGAARSGAWSAIACYLLWGIVPLYWKPLAAINAVELIAHRQVWSLVVLLGLLIILEGGLRSIRSAMGCWRSVGNLLLGGGLLTINWLVYVWGVNTGHIVETSLGYFLVPLFSVVAGRLVMDEQLRHLQWIAVGIAALGVGIMILQADRIPWIALALAGSWGCYGILRKRSRLGAIPALASETLLLAPFAASYLIWCHHRGTGALGQVDLRTHLLILSSGLVTAVPLLLFAHAARRIRLSTLGVLQYIAPTGQLIIGVWIYHEEFTRSRATSFILIWIALLLYTADNLFAQYRKR
jgi:chloramphenicol-sensitive protein RarD